MVFVGVQPTLMQVPPRFFSSISATDQPRSVSRYASGLPAWPEPMMIASCLIKISPPDGTEEHYIRCGSTESGRKNPPTVTAITEENPRTMQKWFYNPMYQ